MPMTTTVHNLAQSVPQKKLLFRQNRAIPSPKPAGQPTKTLSMWGFVGGFSLNHPVQRPENSRKPAHHILKIARKALSYSRKSRFRQAPHPALAVRLHPPSTVHRPPSTVHRLSSIVHRLLLRFALVQQRFNPRHHHIQRHAVLATARDDNVGVALGGFHELFVHRLDGG
jgi:hypothetical protein